MAVASAIVIAPPGAGATPPGQNVNAMINATASRHGVDPRLVAAIVKVESGGNPNAVSLSGGAGLMQLMPGLCRAMGVKEPANEVIRESGGDSSEGGDDGTDKIRENVRETVQGNVRETVSGNVRTTVKETVAEGTKSGVKEGCKETSRSSTRETCRPGNCR